jgi:hypothetical protein
LQDEPRSPDADAQEDPTDGTPEEANRIEENLNLINVVQQNTVVITGRKVKRGQPERDESNSERWL